MQAPATTHADKKVLEAEFTAAYDKLDVLRQKLVVSNDKTHTKAVKAFEAGLVSLLILRPSVSLKNPTECARGHRESHGGLSSWVVGITPALDRRLGSGWQGIVNRAQPSP